MNPMSHAANPLLENDRPMADLMRDIFNPTKEEIESYDRKRKASAIRMHAAIKRLQKQGKW